MGPTLSVPDKFYAECSPVQTTGIKFTVTITSGRPAWAITALTKSNYDNGVSRWMTNPGVPFTPPADAASGYACWPNVTSCAKDTGNTLPPDEYCVAVYKNGELFPLAGNVQVTFTTLKSTSTPSPSPSSASMDGGAIAGIVIGSVAVLAGIIIGIGLLRKRNKNASPSVTQSYPPPMAPMRPSSPGMPIGNGGVDGRDMNFMQPSPGSPVQMAYVPVQPYPYPASSTLTHRYHPPFPEASIPPPGYNFDSAMLSPPQVDTMLSPPQGLEGQFVQGEMASSPTGGY